MAISPKNRIVSAGTLTSLAAGWLAMWPIAGSDGEHHASPPESPFAPDEYTLLLAHFEGSGQADHARGAAEASGSARLTPEGRFGGGVLVSSGGQVNFEGGSNFPAAQGTVEFWLRPGWRGDDGVSRSVFGASGSEMNYLNINKLPNGKFGVGICGRPEGKEFVYRRADTPVQDWTSGAWHHVAICWNGDRLALWLDGRCTTRVTGVLAPQGPIRSIRLGGASQTLDELRISNIERYGDGGAVQGKPVTAQGGLRGSWRFVEPPGAYRAGLKPGQPAPDSMAVIPKDPFGETDPQNLPAPPAEPEIRLFAAPDQVEPASLLVVAGERLEGLRVSATELSSARGKIPADRITVRRVVRTPERTIYTASASQTGITNRFLPRWQAQDVPPGEFREVWLSVDVPAATPAGCYEGSVGFQHAGGRREIPLRLEVLPVRLVEHPRKQLGCYYRMGERLLDSGRVLRELRDMHAHGVRHLVPALAIGYRSEGGGAVPDFGTVRAGLDLIREAGYRDATVVIDSGLVAMARMLVGEPASVPDQGDKHRQGWTFGAHPGFDRAAKQAVEQFQVLSRDYPEFRLVLTHLDEIFGEGRMPLYLRLSQAVRQVPGARLYITFHTRDDQADIWRREIDPFMDLRCHHGYTFEWWLGRGHRMEEYEKELAASGDEAWFYHNARGTYFTPLRRIINGLYLWASPFRVHCPWIYQSYDGNPFDDRDGPEARGHDWVLSGPGIEDPADLVPSRLWEAMRAGATDLRYLASLERAIAAATPDRSAAAAQAQAHLDRLKGLIRNLEPAREPAPAAPGKGPSGQIDLDTGLRMGHGAVGTAAESPVIHALEQQFRSNQWQQIRRQTAEWIVKLEQP